MARRELAPQCGFCAHAGPMLWWFEFVNHTSSERTARRIIEQTASIFCGPGRSGHLTQKSRPASGIAGGGSQTVSSQRTAVQTLLFVWSQGVPPATTGTGLSVKASFPFHEKVHLRFTYASRQQTPQAAGRQSCR